jgi:hypothetical protein
MHWNRSCDRLWAVDATARLQVEVQKMLERDYPPDRFPFDIDVRYDEVHITDHAGINESANFHPDIGVDDVAAVKKAIDLTIGRLRESGIHFKG